jgi:hypothetical protein
MLRDHSTADLTPLPNKNDQINAPLCKQQGATDFPDSLSISRGSFPLLPNKSYFVCWSCCLMSQSAALWVSSWALAGKNPQHRLQQSCGMSLSFVHFKFPHTQVQIFHSQQTHMQMWYFALFRASIHWHTTVLTLVTGHHKMSCLTTLVSARLLSV